MSDQFIFFCTNIGNENLLKEEIKAFYPELALSYSRKGFLTFKNKGVKYDFETISQLQVTFATRLGICLGKAEYENLKTNILKKFEQLSLSLDECLIHNFAINCDSLYDASIEFNRIVNQYSADGKLVLNIMTLGENEIWYGVHLIAKGITRYPNAQVDIPALDQSPSIGALKLAQTSELFSMKIKPRDLWLDFGCSPGGSSSYILSKEARVWGIDTAGVRDSILSHRSFKFIKSSVQDLSQEELPDVDINWVHVDLNLNPNQAIKEVLRLCKRYNRSLKGILFTVQVVKMEYIPKIEEFEDLFYDWGFSSIISRQVPAHKKEYVIIAERWND